MSLKAFHLFFIFVSFLLAVGCAIWAFMSGASITFGIGSAIAALALVSYGIVFVRKARRIIT